MREKKNKKLNKVIIPAETYRDFKTNSVLRLKEHYITKKDENEFRGTAEEKRIR
jgi:hypothetical protein